MVALHAPLAGPRMHSVHIDADEPLVTQGADAVLPIVEQQVNFAPPVEAPRPHIHELSATVKRPCSPDF